MSLLHPGLEAFIAVVRQSTVHGAAREIGLTQTGVTQRIRALERQLGTTLFTRSRKGMHPTPEGEALFRYCQSAKSLEGQLLSFLQNDVRDATVRVTITGPSTIMRCRVIPGATEVLKTWSNISFTFNLNDDESALKQIKTGAAQLGVLNRDEVVNEFDSKLLKPASYILVGPAAWKKRKIKEIVQNEPIIDFNASDDATFQYLRTHDLYDLCIKDRHLANNIDAIEKLIVEGLGYSVLAREFAEPLLAEGKLVDIYPGHEMNVDVALAWYPRHEMPDYFGALIKAIK